MDAGDRLAGEELRHRVAAEGDDDPWPQNLEVAAQPYVACRDLLGQRVTVLRWPVADDVGDEDLAPIEADAGQELVEVLSGSADEWLSLEVLVVAGSLAQEEDPGLRRALSGDRLPGAAMKRTRGAAADPVGDEPEVRV